MTAYAIPALLLLVLLAGWWAASFLPIRWRIQVLAWKLEGALPYLGWLDLLREILPQRMRFVSREVPPGFVRAKESRKGPRLVLWDTPIGSFWGRCEDGQILWLLLLELYGYRLYDRGKVVVQDSDVVLDLGSHLGTFTRFALRRGARLVVAFEPEPTNAACFKQTFLEELAAGRVLLVEAAAWETPGTLALKASDDGKSWGASVLPSANMPGLTTVAATTVDDTVGQLNLEQVDFIKMDIEGAERNAIRGAHQTLSRFGPRMAVAIYHRSDDPAVIPEWTLKTRPQYHFFQSTDIAYFH